MNEITGWAIATLMVVATVMVHYETMLNITDRLLPWAQRRFHGRRLVALTIVALMAGHILEIWLFAVAMLALLQLEQLCAQALEIEADIIPMRQALTTARAYQLSAYDSVYLDLALRARLPLATLDVALGKAAGKAGVELLH